jgi:hypothetical protein
MLAEVRSGIVLTTKNSGAVAPGRSDSTGALVVADGHGKYLETTLQGNTYFLSYPATAVPGAAYVGAAGGTPLLAVHNPAGSNKALALIGISTAPRVLGAAVLDTTLAVWAGASVVPTGTQTSPKSSLTFASGGVGLGFANTALTGSTALNYFCTTNAYFWGTSVGQFHALTYTDMNGILVLMPGMQMAIGSTIAITTVTFEASMIWEEIQL